MRELEVANAGGVRVAVVVERHRADKCAQPKRPQQKETTEKKDFQKPKIAQVSKSREEARDSKGAKPKRPQQKETTENRDFQ